ncbi:MAG: hypothetical protein K5768_10695 [Firmicutes bacterium]|nr:hypothetical protein [Bacillota bacterium]
MAEFVKKTALGYKAVQGGQSDYECTHAILSKSEYSQLLSEIRTAENKVVKAEDDAEQREKNAKAVADRHVRNIRAEAAMQLDEVKQELTTANTEIEYQRELNENLLRINRERANAARKIKPKKEHSGYLITNSKEHEYKYRIDKKNWDSVMLWQTVLESPYGVSFTDEQARKQIYEELFKNHLIGKIGIVGYWNIAYEDMIDDKLYQKEHYGKNIAIKYQLQANYKTGWWEIIILHTNPLSNVPDDMMRCNYS